MKITQLIGVLISIVLLILGNVLENPYIGVLATLMFWLVFLVKMLKNWRKNILPFFFLICFFSFLLGGYLMNLIGMSEFNQDKETTIFALNIIFISLCSIWTGIFFADKIRFTIARKSSNRQSDVLTVYSGLEKLAMVLYWVAFPFYILNFVTRNRFVAIFGYLEYYRSYRGTSDLVSYGNIVCMFAFYLFLACFPSKKRVMPVIISYVIANIMSVFAGSRTNMVVAMVFSLFYLLLRQGREHDKVWINKKFIWMVIIVTPLLLAFLGYWAYYRMEIVQSGMNIADYITSFVESNGGSGSIIGYTYNLQDSLRNTGSHSYTFGYLVRIFSGINYGQSSVEIANSGTSLGATLTYGLNSYMFLRGGGMGTCYIAELWIDFGIIGVCIYNLILGYILSKMSKINYAHTISALISFAVIQELFTLPRSEALCMLPFFTSRIFILLLVITLVLRHTGGEKVVKKKEILYVRK